MTKSAMQRPITLLVVLVVDPPYELKRRKGATP